MIKQEILLTQLLTLRQNMVKLLRNIPPEKADVIPPTWKNNARWQAGHVLLTPHLITFGIMKQPLGLPEDYRKWFARATSPAEWGDDNVPTLAELSDMLVPDIAMLFNGLKECLSEPYAEPYTTSTGFVMHTPGESLCMALIHDGMHMGMLMAMKRGLDAMP